MAPREQVRQRLNPVALQTPHYRVVKSYFQILEAIANKTIKEYKNYKEQAAYILEAYSPECKQVVDVKLFKTQDSYEKIVESYKKRKLYPLLLPNPVKVPKDFWEKYRRAENGYERVKLVKEFGLLADGSILQLRVLVIDIDSEFEKVYSVWEELKEKLAIFDGYVVVKTKSGRFRAYLFLEPTTVVYTDQEVQKQKIKQFYLSVKHLKRAQELVSIILSFFESRKLKADHTFGRLNHPIFPEDIHYDGKTYEIVEFKDGFAGKFYDLYYRMKQIQKEENLWYLGETYLPGKFWGKKERKPKEKKECEIIKAPAFVRILEENELDVLELWKRAVISLSQKYTSYRYIHVIQPAIGWAKYLNLPREEVDAFLLSILGEKKERDIEKGWKYVAELEFKVPERIEWAGKTREEWEKEVRLFLKANNGVAFRQTLIKEVFGGQEWLTDLIMWGMVKKGIVEWRKHWEKKGRGRKPYVFALKVESEALPKAVGSEDSYIPNWLNGKRTVVREEKQKTQNINSSPIGEEQRSGLEVVGLIRGKSSLLVSYRKVESEFGKKGGKEEGRDFPIISGCSSCESSLRTSCGGKVVGNKFFTAFNSLGNGFEEVSRKRGSISETTQGKLESSIIGEENKSEENKSQGGIYLKRGGAVEKLLKLFENNEYQEIAKLKVKSKLCFYFVPCVSLLELRKRNRKIGSVVGKLLSYLTVREVYFPQKGWVVWLTREIYEELMSFQSFLSEPILVASDAISG